jgi:hypothetical protein
MRKILYLLSETWYLIRKERLYALALLLVVLCLVTFLVYQVTPITVVTFIYAGV